MNAAARLEAWLARCLASRTGRRWIAGALALLCLALLLFRLGDAPIVRNPERRCHAAASHIVQTREWLVPVADGAVRLQKPPLYYWAAAAASQHSGGVSRFALRLPAALSAFALLALVFRWGASLGGFACGAVAALSLLQMAQFWSLGRRGVAEMPLACFATSAWFAFDRVYWAHRRALLPGFFLLVWLAFLAKATTALLVIGLPIAIQLALDRSWSRVLRRDCVAWALLCAVLCLAWYAAVLARVPGAWRVLREAALLPLGLTASIGSASHVKPCWFYVPTLIAVASPALLLAPLALTPTAPWRESFDSPRRRFPLVCFASLLLAFSAIPMKQKHYLLPLLPALALLLGTLATQLQRRHPELLGRWIRAVATLLWAGSPALAAGLALHLRLAREGPALLPWLVGACGLLSGALAFAAVRRPAVHLFAAASLLASLTTFVVYESSIRVWRDRLEAGAATRDLDASGFEPAFARHAWLRRFYAADERG